MRDQHSSPTRRSSDLPRFANAAMDGFALRSEDTARAPVRLEARSERSLAGRPAQAHVARGEAMPVARAEEHTSELQSHSDVGCSLLLHEKNNACGRDV